VEEGLADRLIGNRG